MRCASVARFALTLSCAVALAAPVPSLAQGQPATSTPQKMGRDEIAALAKVQIAIGNARDSVYAELAMTRNKTDQAQMALQERLRKEIEEILHHAGLTDAELRRRTFVVSTEPELRKTYDSVVVALTGAPLPGQVTAAAGGGRGGRGGQAAPVPVPAGPVGTHIGHVINGFTDTPGGASLLQTAKDEAGVAAQHAMLARNAAAIDQMKLHAGHVIHALDPTVVTSGPGRGYGLKKAALGIATHIELAAKAEGASPNVNTHSNHIATSARNTVKRTDQLLELAKQVQAATDPAAASALINQMASLASQLVAGADGNGDGRVTWEENEGGLQQAEEHVTLMLRAEGSGR